MNRTTSIALIAGLALVALLFAFNNRVGTSPRRFEREPTVRLTDKDSGEERELPMEDYIKGVVAGEMGQLPAAGGEEADWPQAAYAAQAILARSFALTFLNDEGVVEISTDVEEAQAYAPENITPAIEKAVESTRGEVMLHRGDFVKAWFHSYSGGHTATAKEGLNYQEDEPGFVAARPMPENEFVPDETKAWSASIPLAEVSRSLADRGLASGAVTQVEIVEKGPSGRATQLAVTGAGGTQRVHASEFRLAVGAERMRSTLLDSIDVEGGNLVMRGKGFGHGVGLSQWDAFKMAKDGESPEAIMNAFFQDISVEKAWD